VIHKLLAILYHYVTCTFYGHL